MAPRSGGGMVRWWIFVLCLGVFAGRAGSQTLLMSQPAISGLTYGRDADRDGFYETYKYNVVFEVQNYNPQPVTFNVRSYFDPLGAVSDTGPFTVAGAFTFFLTIPGKFTLTLSADQDIYPGWVTNNTNLRPRIELRSTGGVRLAGPVTVSGPLIKVDGPPKLAIAESLPSSMEALD